MPYEVKEERVKRNIEEGKGKVAIRKTYNGEVTIYYMLSINCKYRRRIQQILKSLKLVNQKRRELEAKYSPLMRDLRVVKIIRIYKPIKGDQIDEMFAQLINESGLNVPVKRLAPGKYMFGTKNIIAKIVNMRLLIRVGGGFMSADEFIEQYGRIEMIKMMKSENPDFDEKKANRRTQGKGSFSNAATLLGSP